MRYFWCMRCRTAEVGSQFVHSVYHKHESALIFLTQISKEDYQKVKDIAASTA